MLRKAAIIPVFMVMTWGVSHAGTVKGQLDMASLSGMKIQRAGDSHFWNLPSGPQEAQAPVAAIVLESDTAKNLEMPSKPTELTISGYGVSPNVVTMRVGEELKITNLDEETYSCRILGGPSPISTNKLAAGKSTTVKVITGGVLKLKCDKFPFMDATIIASESPLCTLANRIGQFQIQKVPPGQYLAKVFAGGQLKWTKKVVVSSTTTNLALGPSSSKGDQPDLAKGEQKPSTPKPNNTKASDSPDKMPPAQAKPAQTKTKPKETKPVDKPAPTKTRSQKSDKTPDSTTAKKPAVKKPPANKPPKKAQKKKKADEGFKDVEPEIEIEVE